MPVRVYLHYIFVLSLCLSVTSAARAQYGDILLAIEGSGSGFFGRALAPFQEDHLAIGDPEAERGGNVFIYSHRTGALQRQIRNPTSRPQEEFGTAVAASGRLILIAAVEAFSDQPGIEGRRVGRVYLYDGVSGELLRAFENPEQGQLDQFGEGLAFVDGRVAIGAPFSRSRTGVAYIFDVETGELIHTLSKYSPTEDHFGAPILAVDGEVIVGAPFDESSGEHRGAAYVFDATTGARGPRFLSPQARPSRAFGTSLAATEERIAIGDPFDSAVGVRTGAVFLFSREGEFQGRLQPEGLKDEAFFGFSASSGVDEIIVGAPQEVVPGRGDGAVYLYRASTGGLLARMERPARETDDSFGHAVTFLPGGHVAVGAPAQSSLREGMVYIINFETVDADPCGASAEDDCNGNGVADSCDVKNRTASDCDGDGVPDACQLVDEDCDGNGIVDSCDIADGHLIDCDENGVPDRCELEANDCNGNRIPDGCDIRDTFGFVGTASFRSVEESPHQVVAADFDGDGRMDLALGNHSSEHVVVHRNLGNRRLDGGTVHVIDGDGPNWLCAADLDGDGWKDIATSNRFSDSVSLLLNEGGAGFRQGPSIELPGAGFAILPAELHGDGRVDLVVASEGGLRILRNDGDLRFSASVLPGDPGVLHMSSGDMDGDGDVDLVTNWAGDGVSIFANDGSGVFQPPVNIELPDDPRVLTVLDTDRDGDLDIAMIVRDRFQFLVNGPEGLFSLQAGPFYGSSSVRHISTGDVDGDGDLDVAVSGARFRLVLNDGNGRFDHAEPLLELEAASSVLARMDADAFADVITTHDRALGVTWGRADGRLQATRSLRASRNADPWSVVAADFSGDGLTDVIAVPRGGDLEYFRQTTDEFERSEIRASPAVNFPEIEVADVDGDEDFDLLLVGGGPAWIDVLLNDGTGNFEGSSRLEAAAAAVSTADFDSDGNVDVIAVGEDDVRVFLNVNGAGSFVAHQVIEAPREPRDVVVADFDGDARVDLITLDRVPPGYSLFQQSPAGGLLVRHFDLREFAGEEEFLHGALATSDIDGDGDGDLVMLLYDTLLVLANDGVGTFEIRQRLTIPGGRQVLDLDADRDGDIDFAVTSNGRNALTVFVNSGQGWLRRGPSYRTRRGPFGLAASDLDGDGLVDLLTANFDESVSILYGAVVAAVSADVDGDSVPDVCGGMQMPGDCDQNGRLETADVVCTLRGVFMGFDFPCGSGSAFEEGNLALIDWQPDHKINVTDAVALLLFLFRDGPPHAGMPGDGSTPRCVRLVDCLMSPGCAGEL